MAIYTKTGDAGETSLVGGTRISKAAPRVCAYGDIDELISHIGLLRAEIGNRDIDGIGDCSGGDYSKGDNSKREGSNCDRLLRRIQENLMLGAAHVASDGNVKKLKHFDESEIRFLEEAIDVMAGQMPIQKAFILPAGPLEAAHCHIARTVCRRGERSTIALNDDRPEVVLIIKYLNRLSDFLFTLGRFLCHNGNISEDFWLP